MCLFNTAISLRSISPARAGTTLAQQGLTPNCLSAWDCNASDEIHVPTCVRGIESSLHLQMLGQLHLCTWYKIFVINHQKPNFTLNFSRNWRVNPCITHMHTHFFSSETPRSALLCSATKLCSQENKSSLKLHEQDTSAKTSPS